MYGVVYHKRYWKQSGLYSSIQKPKPAINHQPVHHCISSQRSVVRNNRNAFNVYNADHRKMGLWRHLMPNLRLSWCIRQLCYLGNPWFDSVNRYMKIVKTNHYNNIFSPSRSKIWLSCLWLSFTLYLLIFRVTNWMRIEFNQSFAVCSFAYPTSESRIFHYCITIGLLFVSPLCVGIFSYYEIFFKIHEHKQNTVSTLQNSPNSRMNDSPVRDISISRVLFFVAAGFLCCWIPMWALALWMRFSPETCPRVVQLIDVFFSYLSASVNPLIYTFTNGEFRREFRKLLRCRNERAWNASNKAISAGDKGDGLLDRRNKRRGVVGFPAV